MNQKVICFLRIFGHRGGCYIFSSTLFLQPNSKLKKKWAVWSNRPQADSWASGLGWVWQRISVVLLLLSLWLYEKPTSQPVCVHQNDPTMYSCCPATLGFWVNKDYHCVLALPCWQHDKCFWFWISATCSWGFNKTESLVITSEGEMQNFNGGKTSYANGGFKTTLWTWFSKWKHFL